MELKLCCEYDLRFTPLVCSFAAESARALGASEREAREVAQAADEAAAHIIENHPGAAGATDRLEVTCELAAQGLQFTLRNTGLPVNVEALPRYDPQRPEDTLDGLPFHLIDSLVDRCEFQNLGHLGWRTVLYKRIKDLEAPAPAAVGSEEDPLARAAENLTVRRATGEDAPAIVELAYRNYGYSYAKETFYFADRLREALASEKVISFVARNPEGRTVGQVALIASEECPEIAEAGALMVLPEYRRSMGLLQMIKLARRFAADPASRFCLLETNFVTAHTVSQQAGMLFRFQPMALKLSVHARADYKGLQGVSAQRESHLYAVVGRQKLPSLELHVPRVHASITASLFRRIAEEPVCLDGERAAAADAPATRLDVAVNAEASLAKVEVVDAGPDLVPCLRRQLHELGLSDVSTVLLEFPTWKPSLHDVEPHADELQIFFSGFVAKAKERWSMLYTRLNRQRFDFRDVQLADPSAVELRAYVEFCRQRVLPA